MQVDHWLLGTPVEETVSFGSVLGLGLISVVVWRIWNAGLMVELSFTTAVFLGWWGWMDWMAGAREVKSFIFPLVVSC